MFFKLKKKKFAKGLDRTVLTGSCGPTLVLTVHGINKKSSSLSLKNRFSSRFPVFTVRPPGLVRFWKPCCFVLFVSFCLKMWNLRKAYPISNCPAKTLFLGYFPVFFQVTVWLSPSWVHCSLDFSTTKEYYSTSWQKVLLCDDLIHPGLRSNAIAQ